MLKCDRCGQTISKNDMAARDWKIQLVEHDPLLKAPRIIEGIQADVCATCREWIVTHLETLMFIAIENVMDLEAPEKEDPDG